ncbi:MAG: TspO/MBR family protein [Candidatus Aenigmatarchaeota archaeon]
MNFSPRDLGQLVLAIFICQLAGIIGSVFTVQSISSWYTTLNKPWFTPPGWVFSPVWITLYALMGVALYWIWKEGPEKREVRIALGIFAGQLSLNAIWSILFFGLQNIFVALIEIGFLWLLILFTIVKFYQIKKRAGVILIPYLAWVTIATLLNYYLWLLN